MGFIGRLLLGIVLLIGVILFLIRNVVGHAVHHQG